MRLANLNMKKYVFIISLIMPFFIKSNQFIKGVDISMLKQVEENGGLFYDNGNQVDAIEIFKDKGFNTVRIKIWHTPSLNYNSTESVLETASRAGSVGLDILLNFHYSDTWADPSNQSKPSAWNNLNFEALCDSVKQYSHEVIIRLKNQNTLPKYVQIGNETDCGFLWPDGYVCGESNSEIQWTKLKNLFLHAIEGINSALDIEDTLKIISHVSSGGNWFFNNLMSDEIDFDILGVSYYPMWHGTLADLNQNINELSNQFQKSVLVLETAYPFTLQWNDNTHNILGLATQLLPEYEASEEGQGLFLDDLISLIDENIFGQGICYWAPDWISTNQFGSPWENQALFDFEGESLEALSVFDDATVSVKWTNNFAPNSIYNYPNPFNATTTLQYHILKETFVRVTIYDIVGNIINQLVNDNQLPGNHSVQWNATDNKGQLIAGGLYFFAIETDNSREIRKMVLLK